MINSIFILDKSKTVVDILSNNGDSPQSPFFDDKYIQDLATGAETFEFTTVSNERTSNFVIAGNYVAFKIKNKIKMFQIMETKEEHQDALYKSCYCEIAGLELINNIIRPREIPSANVRQFFEIVLADTDWKLGVVDAALVLSSNIKIERPINVYSLIQQHLSTFDMEIEYRFEMAGNRISGMYIDAYKNRGINTGFRFEYGDNVSETSKQVDMSELCTAMIGIGKDNIDFKSVQWDSTMPALKPLNQDFIVDVEAHKIWNNNGSYLMGTFTSQTESPNELLALTWNELQRRKQPKMSYDIKVEMLKGYEEEINIGDKVKVIDNEYTPALHLTARIGRLELSFTDHRKNRCILTNFKEVKSGILSLDTIQAIIDGKFPIGSDQIQDGAITDGKIDTEYLHTIKTDVIIAAKADVEELIAGKADIEDLNAINATIENLKVKDAEIENAVIENLKVTTAEIDKLKAKDAEIDNIFAGNITADMMQTGTITAGSGIIAEGAIGNAQISKIDAGKIEAGTIDTSKVTVAGKDSNLKISGNRLQVFQGIGAAQTERVSLGDVNGDGSKYGLLVRGADGKTVLMDENGVTNAGITDGSITNDKINPDANIDGAKININSVVNKINEDGSQSILGTKIDIEGTNLSTKLSSITTTQTEQGEKISQNSSKITANEKAIKLKVDSQTYQTDKTNMTTQLNKNSSAIEVLEKEITSKVESTDIQNALDEYGNVVDSKITTAKSEIKQTTDKIQSSVSKIQGDYVTSSDITQLNNSWTAKFKDGYKEGITQISADGITVSNSDSKTKTVMDSQSFRVLDSTGGDIANFSTNSSIPNLISGTIIADEIYAPNIAQKSPTTTIAKEIYVSGSVGNDNNNGSSTSKFKTIQRAIDELDDVINQPINIYVNGSVPGFVLEGKTGSGAITLFLQDDCVINGTIGIRGNTNYIKICSQNGSMKPTLKNGMYIDRCTQIDLYGLAFRGNNADGTNITATLVNSIMLNTLDLGGTSTKLGCAIYNKACNMWLHNLRGSNITDVVGAYAWAVTNYARAGSVIVPNYTNGFIVNYDGSSRNFTYGGASLVKTASNGWNPPYTPTSRTTTWSFNKIWSDETLNGWPNKNELIQGYASTWNTGRWTGYMQMTDDFAAIRSSISGATNLSGRIYIQRTTSSGNSTGSKLCLYGSDGTVITTSTSINRGQGVWVALSSAIVSKIQSGAIKYFYLKADTSNTSTYFKCESNAKIEITYTK